MPTELASLAAPVAPTPETNSPISRLTQDFDTFLTLLTTQLQNQDPLEPLDTERFTEQLVQFAGVEQSIQTNQNLEALIALQTASDTSTAISLVGRTATVDTDFNALGDEAAEWIYETPLSTESGTIQVFDASERVVAEFDIPGGGRNEFIWNGETASGDRAPDGLYRIVVNAVDANGEAVNADILSRGRVNAVSFDAGGAPLLEINGQQLALSELQRIENN